MNHSNWNAMDAPQKRKVIGLWIIVICRYLMPIVGLNARTSIGMALFLVYGGLFFGLVGLGVYIWGIVGEDLPTPSKIVSILLSIGIVMGGLIGIVCIVASTVLALIAKKKSRQQDDQEMNHW